MKIFFLLLSLLTFNNYLFSQSMVIHKFGEPKDTIDISAVDSIKFLPFQCGINKVRYTDKIYNTIQIGSYCWLKENINIGTMINGSLDQTNNGILEKFCYNNDPANCIIYGGLYQWNEAMQYISTEGTKGICPTGWHIPSYSDLQSLYNAVSGNSSALKSIGEGNGTNTTGFSALLAGQGGSNGPFGALGDVGFFWSSANDGSSNATYMYLIGNDDYIGWFTNSMATAVSVRCLRN